MTTNPIDVNPPNVPESDEHVKGLIDTRRQITAAKEELITLFSKLSEVEHNLEKRTLVMHHHHQPGSGPVIVKTSGFRQNGGRRRSNLSRTSFGTIASPLPRDQPRSGRGQNAEAILEELSNGRDQSQGNLESGLSQFGTSAPASTSMNLLQHYKPRQLMPAIAASQVQGFEVLPVASAPPPVTTPKHSRVVSIEEIKYTEDAALLTPKARGLNPLNVSRDSAGSPARVSMMRRSINGGAVSPLLQKRTLPLPQLSPSKVVPLSFSPGPQSKSGPFDDGPLRRSLDRTPSTKSNPEKRRSLTRSISPIYPDPSGSKPASVTVKTVRSATGTATATAKSVPLHVPASRTTNTPKGHSSFFSFFSFFCLKPTKVLDTDS